MDSKIVQNIETSPFDLQHQQAEIESKIVVALERVAEIFRILLWDKAKNLNLSPIQIQILIFLKHHNLEKSTVSYLSREFNLAKPTVSGVVSALKSKNLIDKIQSPHDTRSYSIRLTQRGTRLVLETENFANPLKQIAADFSDTEKEVFWNVLSRLIFKSNQAGLISIQRMCFNCKFYEQEHQSSYCHLLGKKLEANDIRIDCPEFVYASDTDLERRWPG